MTVKILTSAIIGIEVFCHDPIGTLSSVEEGAIAVFDNNEPVMYALSPQRMAQLLKLEESTKQYHNDVVLDEQLYHINKMPASSLVVPYGKFVMYDGWRPDPDLQHQAAIWGIILSKPVTTTELAAFIAWWQADGRYFHHVQWQQKLARSVHKSRMINSGCIQQNVNHIPELYQSIPDGFRGK